MRWTNTFPHPADNRYHVFVFKTVEMAGDFERRLKAQGIPFETGEEEDEWLFGVHRDHFQRALHENHLLHAEHRTPFIPVRGLRIAMLIGTLAVILLALAGALISSASAQSSPYELTLHGAYQFPLEAVGAEPVVTSETPLELAWTPTGGSSLGLRIDRELNKSWQVATGLEVIRNWSDWDLQYSSLDADGEAAWTARDTLRLRTVRYRLPLIASTRVPFTTDWSLLAGFGVSLDMLPTDVFTAGSMQQDSLFHDYKIFENRIRWWAVPLHAEVFLHHAPRAWRTAGREADGGFTGISVGLRWWQEIAQNRWGELKWQYGTDVASTRFWMGPTSFAIELRLHMN